MSPTSGPSAYRVQLDFLREEEEVDTDELGSIDATIGNTASHNLARITVRDDARSVDVHGGNGRQVIDYRADVHGGDVRLGGDGDQVIARQGTRLENIGFDLGAGADNFEQQRGSGFANVDVQGGGRGRSVPPWRRSLEDRPRHGRERRVARRAHAQGQRVRRARTHRLATLDAQAQG